jgi:hypothetical protein
MTLKKTEAGQRELNQRSQALTRTQRTLLVLADGTRERAQLLEMVRGATGNDIEHLLHSALIVDVVHEGVARTATTAAVSARPDTGPKADAGVQTQNSALDMTTLGYEETYASLNALVREHLGLLKAFKYTLDVEKAQGLAELLLVAERFVAEVQASKGPAAARRVRRALGLPG